MAKCKYCGAEIIWSETGNGKKMPCDETLIHYQEQKGAKDCIVIPNGQVIRCILNVSPDGATGIGYIPHWATCKG